MGRRISGRYRPAAKHDKKMRVKIAGELGKVYPPAVEVVKNYYHAQCQERGLCFLEFRVDGLPRSLNHQYEDGLSFCKPGTPGSFQDKQGRWRVRNYRLKSDVLDWRNVVSETLGERKYEWQPTGITAAILLFEGPHWLTARRLVREEDADNKAKPTFDAIEKATGVPDELHWQFHVFKVLSKRRRTSIFLYDLGDVVEYYY